MESQNEVVRKFAKYIFIDVVQFSKRSAEAQSDIIKSFNSIVHRVLGDLCVNKDNDCILIPTGDGMCISLLSPDLSFDVHIQIALSILRSIDEYNKATENETRQFQVRIGLNQNTDILVTDVNGRRNLAGAGVNVAARVMDKADGGQILVSQSVLHELQPSEIYMDTFQEYSTTGKHGLRFKVHQYKNDSYPGLNTEVPSAFVPPIIQKKSLTDPAAFYFVHAIIHKKDLLSIKKGNSDIIGSSSAVVLLRLLSEDAFRLSRSSEFGRPDKHIYGGGSKTFEELFAYYNSQNYWVLADAAKYCATEILAPFSDCFEKGRYGETLYAFLNNRGVEKLKEEKPDLWEKFELDTYV